MQPRTLLVLSLVVAALAAFIWFVERDLPGSDERVQLEKRVVSIDSQDISELIIERDGQRVHLTRSAEAVKPEVEVEDAEPMKREWRLLEPLDARADRAKADRLADTLALIEKARTLDEVEPSAVGLDAPRAVVTLRTPDDEVELAIGTEIPATTNMILGRGGETFAVANAVWTQLEIDPGDWRSRDPFPLHRNAVERAELTNAEGGVVLTRREDDFWLELPMADAAEKELVDELLDAMFTVEVEEFLDEPSLSLEEMGLAEPEARLEVAFTSLDAPSVLEVGAASISETDQRYARIDGQLVTLGTGLDSALARAPSEWQASSWTALEVFEIDSFRAVDGQGEVLLERSGADWARDGVRISYQPVSDFLYALTGAAGERVVSRDDAGVLLSEPSLELTLEGGPGEEVLALHDTMVSAIATREGRDFVLELSEGTVEDLRLKLQAIRDEPVLGEESVEEDEG